MRKGYFIIVALVLAFVSFDAYACDNFIVVEDDASKGQESVDFAKTWDAPWHVTHYQTFLTSDFVSTNTFGIERFVGAKSVTVSFNHVISHGTLSVSAYPNGQGQVVWLDTVGHASLTLELNGDETEIVVGIESDKEYALIDDFLITIKARAVPTEEDSFGVLKASY